MTTIMQTHNWVYTYFLHQPCLPPPLDLKYLDTPLFSHDHHNHEPDAKIVIAIKKIDSIHT